MVNRGFRAVDSGIAEVKMLSAKILIEQIATRGPLANIQEAEFKVFSQSDEDGIIQYLIRQVGMPYRSTALSSSG
jgi:hypothetical protein